jgi:hypothetical protein
MAIVDDVKSKLRSFFDEVAAFSRTRARDIPIRSDDRWSVVRENGDRRLNLERRLSPDYLLFLGSNFSSLQTFASFLQLQDSILSNAKLSKAFLGSAGSGDVIWYATFRYLLPVLAGLLREADAGGQWDALVAERLILLNDFLAKDTYPVQLYAPLLNFRSDVNDIEVADGIRVCEISDAKLEAYVNTISSFMGQTLVHQLLPLRFQLESVIELPRLSPISHQTRAVFRRSAGACCRRSA